MSGFCCKCLNVEVHNSTFTFCSAYYVPKKYRHGVGEMGEVFFLWGMLLRLHQNAFVHPDKPAGTKCLDQSNGVKTLCLPLSSIVFVPHTFVVRKKCFFARRASNLNMEVEEMPLEVRKSL